MSAVPKRRMSIQEYFAIEREAPFKSEYFAGEMFAMAGASSAHNFIRENLSIELGGQLKGSPCRTLSCDQRLKVERTGLVTYPDLMIICGPLQVTSEDRDTINNPVTIVEVLSPSTESYDRGAKFRNYQQIESLKEYVLITQDEAVCERFVRQDNGAWELVTFAGLDSQLAFTTVDARVALLDLYQGVTFPEIVPPDPHIK
jgi:Uma2 family endonuclease